MIRIYTEPSKYTRDADKIDLCFQYNRMHTTVITVGSGDKQKLVRALGAVTEAYLAFQVVEDFPRLLGIFATDIAAKVACQRSENAILGPGEEGLSLAWSIAGDMPPQILSVLAGFSGQHLTAGARFADAGDGYYYIEKKEVQW